jgi:hypothetical protein
MLDYMDQLPRELHPELVELLDTSVREFERLCPTVQPSEVYATCQVIIAQLDLMKGEYSEGAAAIDRASDANPRYADAYYARANLYFDLALADIIRQNRFNFTDDLTAEFTVTEGAEILFAHVKSDNEAASRYPGAVEVGLPQFATVSPALTAARSRVVEAVSEGARTFRLERFGLLRGVSLMREIFSDDPTTSDRQQKYATAARIDQGLHPEEWIGAPPLSPGD